MSHLQTRYTELQSAGRVPLWGDDLTIVRPERDPGISRSRFSPPQRTNGSSSIGESKAAATSAAPGGATVPSRANAGPKATAAFTSLRRSCVPSCERITVTICSNGDPSIRLNLNY